MGFVSARANFLAAIVAAHLSQRKRGFVLAWVRLGNYAADGAIDDSPRADGCFWRRGWSLIAPARPAGALPAELEALLPNRRHNGDLMAGLHSSLGEASFADGAIAAIFAADPFINVREMTSALATVGIGRVANFPSVAQYGKVFEQSLSEVGLGVQREQAILKQFRKLGLQTYQTLAETPSSGVRSRRPCRIPDCDFLRRHAQRNHARRNLAHASAMGARARRPETVDADLSQPEA